MAVQSVLFSRDAYSATQARRWLHSHDFVSWKVDVTPRYLRFRQLDPVPGARYFTLTPAAYPGVRLVVRR